MSPGAYDDSSHPENAEYNWNALPETAVKVEGGETQIFMLKIGSSPFLLTRVPKFPYKSHPVVPAEYPFQSTKLFFNGPAGTAAVTAAVTAAMAVAAAAAAAVEVPARAVLAAAVAVAAAAVAAAAAFAAAVEAEAVAVFTAVVV